MNIEEKSYVFGLLMADGSIRLLKRNRGCVLIELAIKDSDIIYKLEKLIPSSKVYTRKRDIKIGKYLYNDNETIKFCNFQLEFRKEMIDFGFPIENKTQNSCVPILDYSERDFWRGIIDGDGSLGYIEGNIPFISLVTKSDKLKDSYLNFLEKFGINKSINKNKRDNIYNIIVKNEKSLKIVDFLYKESCCSLQRKYECYIEMMKWKRPEGKRINNNIYWSIEEIDYLRNNSLNDCYLFFKNRSKSSIQMKKYRLNGKFLYKRRYKILG